MPLVKVKNDPITKLMHNIDIIDVEQNVNINVTNPGTSTTKMLISKISWNIFYLPNSSFYIKFLLPESNGTHAI